MNWQEWIVWAIFAVVVVVVWRWIWRTFFCRSRDCENCTFGHCGIRSEKWQKEHDELNKQ